MKITIFLGLLLIGTTLAASCDTVNSKCAECSSATECKHCVGFESASATACSSTAIAASATTVCGSSVWDSSAKCGSCGFAGDKLSSGACASGATDCEMSIDGKCLKCATAKPKQTSSDASICEAIGTTTLVTDCLTYETGGDCFRCKEDFTLIDKACVTVTTKGPIAGCAVGTATECTECGWWWSTPKYAESMSGSAQHCMGYSAAVATSGTTTATASDSNTTNTTFKIMSGISAIIVLISLKL